MTEYDEALQEWGARKIEEKYASDRWYPETVVIERGSVNVSFEYDRESFSGCDTCGGSESSASVTISGNSADENNLQYYYTEIEPDKFDLGVVLHEVLAIAEEKDA